jgi:hypothetical protein
MYSERYTVCCMESIRAGRAGSENHWPFGHLVMAWRLDVLWASAIKRNQ